MNDSTPLPRNLAIEFHDNPVGFRVQLPNGSLAVVREVLDASDGRLLRVQGTGFNGRFCKLPKGVHHWYSPSELQIVYFTASVRDGYRGFANEVSPS